MVKEIVIISHQIAAETLHHELGQISNAEGGLTFQLRTNHRRVRGVDPTILVAIVGAASTVLGTLIGGILKLSTDNGLRKIRILGRSGAEIEVPANTPLETIEKYVGMAKDLDIERIHID